MAKRHRSAAEKWLAIVDGEKYAENWKETAELFRTAVPPDQWEQSMRAVRKPTDPFCRALLMANMLLSSSTPLLKTGRPPWKRLPP